MTATVTIYAGYVLSEVTDLALHVEGWASNWHPRVVKTQLSLDQGKDEAIARKRAENS